MSEEYARVPVQARIDVRHLAGIAVYLTDNGGKPRSRSDLVSQIVSIFHRTMVEGGEILPVGEVHDAKKILDQLGLGFTKGTPSHDRLVAAMQKENRLLEAVKVDLDTKVLEDEMRRILEQKLKEARGEETD